MHSLIIESQYFGTIDYIITLFQNKYIEIEQFDNYQKMGFRNRCMVAGSNGLVNLTVPLERGRDGQQLMRDVRVSYEGRWQQEQIRTVESCYSRAPYFEYFWDEVRRLLESREPFLLQRNMMILEWLKSFFKMPGNITLTTEYRSEYPPGITDRRNLSRPKNYLSLDTGIRYTQVFEDRIGFQPNLSILDYLFCCGPDLKTRLKDSVLTI